MVKRISAQEQNKLGIKTLDCNIPENHISRFVVDFIEEVFPMLNIEKPEKKKVRNSFTRFHVESVKIIADMARYHEIYKICF